MKRWIILPVLLTAALLFAAAGIADPGDGAAKNPKPAKTKPSNNKFTFTVTTTDNGSCGNPWANDVIKRTFHVKRKSATTWRVERIDRGTFTTIGGVSPGKCDTKGKHGTAVPAGVTGRFNGYLRGTVTGTYDPSATCAADCGSTDTFIATHFGAAAVNTFTCFKGYAGCRFNFIYNAKKPHLLYRHWQDRGTNGKTEVFTGDIANA